MTDKQILYLIIILFILWMICGCKSEPHKIKYPQIVHNSCTNKWAILVDSGKINNGMFVISYGSYNLYVGLSNRYVTLIGENRSIDTLFIDTITNALLGNELQFNDSISAVKVWNIHLSRQKIRDSIKRYNDSLVQIQKRIEDSLWKCQHAYEIK